MDGVENTVQDKRSLKPLWITLLCIGCCLVIFFGFKWRYNIQFWFGAKLMVAVMNQATPKWLDETTRLDSVKVSNKTMYSFTALKLNDDVDSDVLARNLNLHLVNFIKTDPQLASLRFLEWTAVYNYYDMEGNPLVRCEITPEMYKTQKDE